MENSSVNILPSISFCVPQKTDNQMLWMTQWLKDDNFNYWLDNCRIHKALFMNRTVYLLFIVQQLFWIHSSSHWWARSGVHINHRTHRCGVVIVTAWPLAPWRWSCVCLCWKASTFLSSGCGRNGSSPSNHQSTGTTHKTVIYCIRITTLHQHITK